MKDDVETSSSNPRGENAQNYLRFEDSGINGSFCYLVKRDPYIHKIVSIEAVQNIVTTYTPDKKIYTGVTVGGVTTGGFDTIKGGYSFHNMGKTGEYYLSYKYAILLGTNWTSRIITNIVLSPTDYETAKRDSILKKYVVSKEKTGQGEKGKHTHRYKKNLLVVGFMSKSDCQYLLSWLCNE